jgi:hypothetical protein
MLTERRAESGLGALRGEQFRRSGGRWVGTTLVLGELHGHLIRRADASTARRVVRALLGDPSFEWHDATTDLVVGAIGQWLERYTDQRFSLTDAVTFELGDANESRARSPTTGISRQQGSSCRSRKREREPAR